jgi:hypothetical protein
MIVSIWFFIIGFFDAMYLSTLRYGSSSMAMSLSHKERELKAWDKCRVEECGKKKI